MATMTTVITVNMSRGVCHLHPSTVASCADLAHGLHPERERALSSQSRRPGAPSRKLQR